MFKKLPFLTLLLSLCVSGYAQQIPCPPNLDFEFGDFTSWEPFIGTASPGVANPPAPAVPMTVVNNWQGGLGVIAGRHTVTSGTGTDYYGGFPVVAPGGGSHSLKLSDAAGG